MNCRLSYSLLTVTLAVTGWAADPAGVHNFQQVGDHVYRGAQPTARGLENLQKMGVRTIIDLRGEAHRADLEKSVVERAGMRYVHIPLSGYRAPTDAEMAKVFAAMNDSSGWPVFIHCRRGADRTGTVIACYRIAHDHWNSRKALEEAKLRKMSWTEWGMQRYILGFDPKRCCATAITENPSPPQPALTRSISSP